MLKCTANDSVIAIVCRWIKDTSERGVEITVATAVTLAFLGQP